MGKKCVLQSLLLSDLSGECSDFSHINATYFFPKRILWSGLPEDRLRQRPTHGGNQKQNRAVGACHYHFFRNLTAPLIIPYLFMSPVSAASIFYPGLTMRECLHLSGFDDEELNTAPNPKYPWRTDYVKWKDTLREKIKRYCSGDAEKSRNRKAWSEIRHFMSSLDGEAEDRVQMVFGEGAELLPRYLEAAEEKTSQGIFQEEIRAKAKRKLQELDETTDGDEHLPSKKQAVIDSQEDVGDHNIDEVLVNAHEDVAEESTPEEESSGHACLEVANDPLEYADLEESAPENL